MRNFQQTSNDDSSSSLVQAFLLEGLQLQGRCELGNVFHNVLNGCSTFLLAPRVCLLQVLCQSRTLQELREVLLHHLLLDGDAAFRKAEVLIAEADQSLGTPVRILRDSWYVC